MTTLIRVTREEAVLYLAYIAAACSFFAYREARSANHEAAGARAHASWTRAEVNDHRNEVEDDDLGERVDEVREADEDELTDLDEADE